MKNTSFEFFGPFIVTLKGFDIDSSLIKHFLSMGDPRHSGSNNDNTFHCAFNFPAVIFTLGAERWDELKTLYFTLIRDTQWRVRRSLSYSIHEIAGILGPEITFKELLPIVDLLLKDINDV